MAELAKASDGWNTGEEPMVGASSFEEFYEAERVRLFKALVVITGGRQEAEDICQDAFLRVWERWEHVGMLDDAAGYLHRTAMNAFRDRYRRAKLGLGRGVRSVPTTDPYGAVDDRSLTSQLLGALAPRQRAAIVLTEGLGYSADEAGRFLGIKGSTVRALCFQARSALKETMETIDG